MQQTESLVLNYFPNILCLNTSDDIGKERWKKSQDEFNRIGLPVTQFLAYPGEDTFKSFNISQKEMIADCVRHPGAAFLLEDDVEFKGTLRDIDACLSELPMDWDILYLGANTRDEKPERYSAHLCRIKQAWTTHAVMYSEEMLKHIDTLYDYRMGMYDDWLSREILPNFNCFIANPMICWQRPGKSVLWERETDYTPCFVDGNKKMK